MVGYKVSEMIEKARGIKFQLPSKPMENNFEDRLNLTRQNFFMPNPLEVPKNPSDKEIIEWIGKFEREHQSQLNKPQNKIDLIKRLPLFEKSNEEIIEEVKKLYFVEKDHYKAGDIAHQYLAITPFTNDYLNAIFLGWKNRFPEEPIERLNLYGDIVKYQFDYSEYLGMFEFKLTQKSYINQRLKEAILQLFVYDFIERCKTRGPKWKELLVEIACIDEEKIYTFGWKTELIKVDKEILKSIFECNQFDNMGKVSKKIDSLYDNESPLMADEALKSYLKRTGDDEGSEYLNDKYLGRDRKFR